jgi:hypothetical protein
LIPAFGTLRRITNAVHAESPIERLANGERFSGGLVTDENKI